MKLLEDEGITFVTNLEVGKDKMGSDLLKENDALLLSTGSTWPRDLPIPGNDMGVEQGCMLNLGLKTEIFVQDGLKGYLVVNSVWMKKMRRLFRMGHI